MTGAEPDAGWPGPRRLLALDAAGALLSAVLLGGVVARWEALFGMPRDTVLLLAALPVGFLLYDLACLGTGRADRPAALLPIAALNAGYCAFSVGMMVRHAGALTPLGWAWFGGEVAIVITLAAIQARAARGA